MAAPDSITTWELAAFATHPEHGLAAVADLDPVPALLEAVKTRQGAAQKNSPIAIAKLAPSPQCMAKIRGLRALEIISQTVRM